jgi:hypothetical protein
MISRSLRAIRCSCGSGKFQTPVYDARSIFLTYVCEQCRERKLAGFRSDILTDPNYPTTEPIEPE